MSYSAPALSSGRLTASAVIASAPCYLKSVILEGDGTNACNVILYDNATAASGTILAKLLLQASGPQCYTFDSTDGVNASKGIYAAVTGTGAAYIVHFSAA